MFFPYPSLFVEETPERLIDWARTQPRNIEYFCQKNMYPPVAFYIHINDSGREHARVVFTDQFEEEAYKNINRFGHRWYLQEIMSCGTAVDGVNKIKWKKVFDTVCRKIDKAIKRHHGIQCVMNGRAGFQDESQNVILHFCNVLVIAMRKRALRDPPNVLIPSSQFSEVSSKFYDTFFSQELTSEEKYFTFFNGDIFYHIYGLWYNFSNKPIRVENVGIMGLERSTIFANNDLYKKHQEGKYQSLKRRVRGQRATTLYLCE